MIDQDEPVTLDEFRALGASVREPAWDARGRVHDWRNHIPNQVADVWADLSDDARGVATYLAQIAASNERWD